MVNKKVEAIQKERERERARASERQRERARVPERQLMIRAFQAFLFPLRFFSCVFQMFSVCIFLFRNMHIRNICEERPLRTDIHLHCMKK